MDSEMTLTRRTSGGAAPSAQWPPGSLTDVVSRIERLPMTNYQRKLFAVVATGWLADQVNVALLGFLLVTLKDYFHLSLFISGVLGSMTYAGQLIGNVLAGWAADRWGGEMSSS